MMRTAADLTRSTPARSRVRVVRVVMWRSLNMKKIKEKFWKAIYRMAKQELKKAHLKRIGNDIKCPGCKEWFSVSGIDHKHKTEKPVNKDYYVAVCGQCGTRSNWNPHIAPVLIRVDDTGTPINT